MNYLLPLAKPESVPTVPGSHEYSTHRATTKSHDAVNWDDFPSQDPDTLGRQLSELGKIFASGQGLPEVSCIHYMLQLRRRDTDGITGIESGQRSHRACLCHRIYRHQEL
jgi:hypothetical protein